MQLLRYILMLQPTCGSRRCAGTSQERLVSTREAYLQHQLYAACSGSTPAAVAPAPTATAKGWTSWLFIPFAAAVIVIGTLATFLSRWRKRRLVEQASEQNLSFSNEVSSDAGEVDKPVVPKAA